MRSSDLRVSQYLELDTGVTNGRLKLGAGVSLFWYLLRIV
jgi:hypothetical protein